MRRGAGVVALVAASMVATACDREPSRPRGGNSASSTTTTSDPATTAPAPSDQAVEVDVPTDRPRGGSVRVGVWAAPDPEAPTTGGAAVRALVLPQLFVARPDGRWSPSMVEPGSDVTAADGLSATFRFRSGAVWSDGTALSVDDLRRTADARFVTAVEGPSAEDGTVTVRFPSPLPGWRRLWSAQDSIAAPRADVWGGPFVVSSVVPGLETVLTRNPSWVGAAAGSFLDEVRLVLVPDPTTARQLLAAGQLDVVMPPAATVRTPQLTAIAGVEVESARRGGWSVVLAANADALPLERRRALFASLDRSSFVSTLLPGEASPLQGFAPSGEDGTWIGVGVGGASDVAPLEGETVDLVGWLEEPMTPLLHRSIQKRVRSATEGRGTIELRLAEADRVEGWLTAGSYEAAVAVWLDPLGGCWTCRWGAGAGPEAATLARAADAGDSAAIAALQGLLRDSALVLPLWRPTTVVAWRSAVVSGPKANGHAASAAWNAWEWWRPTPASAPTSGQP